MIWKSIPGFSGYIISEHGNVIRKSPKGNRKLKESSQSISFHGYPVVSIEADDGKRKVITVHRLVALAFHGPAPSHEQRFVLHNDGNHLNPHYQNLRWGTSSENAQDAIKLGTRKGGRKLTVGEVIEIRTSDLSIKALAQTYGVTYSGAWHVKTGRNWKGVQ